MDDIISGTDYYCDNHYEAYAYSAGAMDKAHYSINKHYDIIKINKLIYIIYSVREEKLRTEYENYILNNNCKLVE